MSKKKSNKRRNRKKNREEQERRRSRPSKRSIFLSELNSGIALRLLNRPSLQFNNPNNDTSLDEDDFEPPRVLYVDVDPEPRSKNTIIYDDENNALRVLSILDDSAEIKPLIKKLQSKILRTINSFIPIMPEIVESPIIVDIMVEDSALPRNAFSIYKDIQGNYQWILPQQKPPVLGEIIFPMVRVSSTDDDFLAERDLNKMIDNMLYLSDDEKKQALN